MKTRTNNQAAQYLLTLVFMSSLINFNYGAEPSAEKQLPKEFIAGAIGADLIAKIYPSDNDFLARGKVQDAWRQIASEAQKTQRIATFTVLFLDPLPPKRSVVLARLGKPDATTDEKTDLKRADGSVITRRFHWYGILGVAFSDGITVSGESESFLMVIAYDPKRHK